MNQKNSLGLNNCFLDLDDPIQLFKIWMEEAKKSEPNDPNAVALASSNKSNFPSVRMVLLKDFNKNGFVFYTNLNSQKGNDLKENPNAAMCFHWKSLLRQIRINGKVTQAFRGGADIFYFMPGLRYFIAINKVIFGSTNHGYLLITLLIKLETL